MVEWYEGMIMWYPPIHIIFYTCWFLIHYFSILFSRNNRKIKYIARSALTAFLVIVSTSFFWELGILYRNNIIHYNTTNIIVYFIPLQIFYLLCFALALGLGNIDILKHYNILLLMLSFSFTIILGVKSEYVFGWIARVVWNISVFIMFRGYSSKSSVKSSKHNGVSDSLGLRTVVKSFITIIGMGVFLGMIMILDLTKSETLLRIFEVLEKKQEEIL